MNVNWKNPWILRIAAVVVIVAVVGSIALSGKRYLNYQMSGLIRSLITEQCLAYRGDTVYGMDLEQVKNATIIADTAIELGLPPRAASIAIATAWQESDLRNISYGHLDSVGLFQQRPSQGWGTVAELQDPVFATKAFYRALLKVPGWQTMDLNDAAQRVQRSAVPQGYRKWVPAAKLFGASLTGEIPASFGCLVRSNQPANPEGLAKAINTALTGKVTATVVNGKVEVKASSPQYAWAAGNYAIAHIENYGFKKVIIGTRTWTLSPKAVSIWHGNDDPAAKTVVIEF